MIMLMERRDIEAPTAEMAVIPDQATFGQVLSRVARGALPRDRRLEISFDESTGDYQLGTTEPA